MPSGKIICLIPIPMIVNDVAYERVIVLFEKFMSEHNILSLMTILLSLVERKSLSEHQRPSSILAISPIGSGLWKMKPTLEPLIHRAMAPSK